MPGVGRKTEHIAPKSAQPPVDREIAELARAQHGVVGLRQLGRFGLSGRAVSARVARGRLHRLHQGVFAVGHRRLTARGVLMAAALAAGPGARISHRDAAALWNLVRLGAGRTHVTVDTRAGRARRDGLVIHRSRLHPGDVTTVDAIPVTSVSRTLLDLAGLVSAGRLRRLYAEAERLELLDTTSLTALLNRSSGRRGTARLRALVGEAIEPEAHAASELEHRFLDLLRGAGLPLPQTNVLVEGMLVDALWPDTRLVAELDGFEFHSDRDAFERDRARDARLKRAGYEVVRFTWRRMRDEPGWVAATVGGLLSRARGGACA